MARRTLRSHSASWSVIERNAGTTRASERTQIRIGAKEPAAVLADSAEVAVAAEVVARLADAVAMSIQSPGFPAAPSVTPPAKPPTSDH